MLAPAEGIRCAIATGRAERPLLDSVRARLPRVSRGRGRARARVQRSAAFTRSRPARAARRAAHRESAANARRARLAARPASASCSISRRGSWPRRRPSVRRSAICTAIAGTAIARRAQPAHRFRAGRARAARRPIPCKAPASVLRSLLGALEPFSVAGASASAQVDRAGDPLRTACCRRACARAIRACRCRRSALQFPITKHWRSSSAGSTTTFPTTRNRNHETIYRDEALRPDRRHALERRPVTSGRPPKPNPQVPPSSWRAANIWSRPRSATTATRPSLKDQTGQSPT